MDSGYFFASNNCSIMQRTGKYCGSFSYFESKFKGMKIQHEVGEMCELVLGAFGPMNRDSC
jgi:hypothetical protein